MKFYRYFLGIDLLDSGTLKNFSGLIYEHMAQYIRAATTLRLKMKRS